MNSNITYSYMTRIVYVRCFKIFINEISNL